MLISLFVFTGMKGKSSILKKTALPLLKIMEKTPHQPSILKKKVSAPVQPPIPQPKQNVDEVDQEITGSSHLDQFCCINLSTESQIQDPMEIECDNHASEEISESLSELDECLSVNGERPQVLIELNAHASQETQRKDLNLMKLIRSDEDLVSFTGINFRLLSVLTELVQLAEQDHDARKFNNKASARIVLCLCKLRLNLSFQCLAVLFQMTRQACSNNFVYMIKLLCQLLEKTIYWPTEEEFASNLPKCFENYPLVRVVLDCTEIPVERPGCLKCRLRLYSHYKGCETLKLLIGVTPSGLINYISKVFGGRASDKAIFNQSCIFNNLKPTVDMIMVDKGFDIENECAMNHIKLIIPPKLGKRTQFPKQEVALTADIAAARVHVERAIQRFKMFKIVKHKVAWSLVPYMNDITTVVAALVNVKSPILADDKF